MGVRTGFDTGVFVLLAAKDPTASRLWSEAVGGERQVLVSALTLFELYRLGLRGAVPYRFAKEAMATVPSVCEVVWIENAEQIKSGAQLSQGLALSLADSIILSSLVDHHCHEVYTTDPDLARYKRKDVVIRILAEP